MSLSREIETATSLDAGPRSESSPVPADFQIVPLRLLPVSAGVLIALIVAIESNELWALEFFHVGGGALWTTLDLFVGFVVGPAIARSSPLARMELTARLMPKMLVIMPTLVSVTLVSGWQLGLTLGAVSSAHPLHGWIVASYIAVGIMLMCALLVGQPANVAVLFELKKPRPDPAIITALTKRYVYTVGVLGTMQLAILVIMTKVAIG